MLTRVQNVRLWFWYECMTPRHHRYQAAPEMSEKMLVTYNTPYMYAHTYTLKRRKILANSQHGVITELFFLGVLDKYLKGSIKPLASIQKAWFNNTIFNAVFRLKI